jgi:hypothetical protein
MKPRNGGGNETDRDRLLEEEMKLTETDYLRMRTRIFEKCRWLAFRAERVYTAFGCLVVSEFPRPGYCVDACLVKDRSFSTVSILLRT